MDFYELLLSMVITVVVVAGIAFFVWLKGAIEFERFMVVMAIILLVMLGGIAALK